MTDTKKIKINPLSVYVRSGGIAGSASKYGDVALARLETSWARRAFALEGEPYRTHARKAWNQAYSDGYKFGRAGI